MKNDLVATLLRSASLRATNHRIAVLTQMNTAHTPLSVEEIHSALKHTSIDRVTIYRTLQSFATAHLVREVDLKRGHVLYELYDDHDHHHLVCTTCGKTEDFTGCDIESLASRALRYSKSFTSITEHSLELFGTCTSCTS